MERDEWGFDIPPTESGGGMGWQDVYGRGITPSVVEQRGPAYLFEDGLIAEIDALEFLKSLPEMQRLAIQKRMDGIPLTNAEHNALHHARKSLRKWLGLSGQEKRQPHD